MTRPPSVFISHNWTDKVFARRLASDLRAAGVTVWIDEAEIRVGDSLIEKIREAIDTVDYVVAILSPAAVRSEWVRRELDVAMNQEIQGHRVKVIPLLYQRCELPGFLMGKLYADFTDLSKYQEAFTKVLECLGLGRPRLEKTDVLQRGLSGAWLGEWHHKDVLRRAELEIFTDEPEPKGLMNVSFHKDGVLTLVRERFSAQVTGSHLVLTATGFEFVEKGNAIGWHLDAFDLRLDEATNELRGCRTDSRGRETSVVFWRPRLLVLDIGGGTADISVWNEQPEFAAGVDIGALVDEIREVVKRHALDARRKRLPDDGGT